MSDLAEARYVSLTTYRRDGTGVATPVWIARSGDAYLFTTASDAWKVRRLRNDPRVRVQVCNVRGRVASGAAVHTGTGEVKSDAASVSAATRSIAGKYGWQLRAATLVHRASVRFHKNRERDPVAVELTLDPELPET